MFWALVFGVDDWLHRHARVVAIASALLFALVCADYAGFVKLPVVIAIPAKFATVLAVLRYALWDGFVTPRLMERRRESTKDYREAKGKGV